MKDLAHTIVSYNMKNIKQQINRDLQYCLPLLSVNYTTNKENL